MNSKKKGFILSWNSLHHDEWFNFNPFTKNCLTVSCLENIHQLKSHKRSINVLCDKRTFQLSYHWLIFKECCIRSWSYCIITIIIQQTPKLSNIYSRNIFIVKIIILLNWINMLHNNLQSLIANKNIKLKIIKLWKFQKTQTTKLKWIKTSLPKQQNSSKYHTKFAYVELNNLYHKQIFSKKWREEKNYILVE